jgi:hypothetical protein
VLQHGDGFVAYPLGLRGVVVGQGDSGPEAHADAQSAARFRLETFGREAFDDEADIRTAYVTEADVA